MKFVRFLAVFLILFSSCGIEDYPFIYSIYTGYIQNEFNSRVIIYISDENQGSAYFTNYTIFYRIYISDVDIASPSESDFMVINNVMYNDHSRIRPYIGNDSMGSSSIDTLFRNMNYYPISLEGADIGYILSPGSSNPVFNKNLVIDFSRDSENVPYLTLGTGPRYNLLRADGVAGNYQVLPGNRYFMNTQELLSEENISDTTINGDVTDKPNAEKRNTYVSMYIIASGVDPQTFVQLYSAPAHVGVLQLPNQY